jgi:hypothetical protein
MTQRAKVKVLLFIGLPTVCALAFLLIKFMDDPFFRTARTMGRLERIGTASQEYFDSYGKWPENLLSLTSEQRWAGLITNDAWGNTILYHPYQTNRGYGSLVTYGSDGIQGGTGKNADGAFYFGPGASVRARSPIAIE